MKRQLFNDDWQVTELHGLFGLQQTDGVQTVTLPHDAMFYKRRTPDAPIAAGSYPGGKWQYRKLFFVPESDAQKKICLYFENIFERALIYINGDFVCNQAYGYTPLLIEADRYLKFGAENEIKIILHIADSARWYSGAGILRDAWLLTSESVHIDPLGVRISTVAADQNLADLLVTTTLRNDSGKAKVTVQVKTEILDRQDTVIATNTAPVTILRDEKPLLRQKLYVPQPQLWSPNTPDLYRCHTQVYDETGNLLDQNWETFGIRTLRINPQQGLLINGTPVKLRGAAVHHDNGPAGAISLDSIEERRLGRLKAAGFNAIRTAHNPPSPAFYRACDKLGLLVMAEAFDTWGLGKVDFDHTLDFQRCWEDDLTAMVAEAFNHPSVILYSIGNEIADTGSANGSVLGRSIAEKLRSLDPTRLIINCINGMVSVMSIMDGLRDQAKDNAASNDQQGQNAINDMMSNFGDVMRQIMQLDAITQATAESYACVDVGGYNYMDSRYEMDKQLFPNRLICGTETLPPTIDQVWSKVKANSHVIGDFVWTGWDYMGEPSTGLVKYTPPPIEYGMGCPFPALLSHVGEFTICGHRRPASYYHEIVLGQRKEPYIAVQRPEHHDDSPISTPWSWSDSVGSWSWPGCEGYPVKIEVYADADEVELFQDDVSLGRQAADEIHRFKAFFETTWRPGCLTAVAYVNGVEKSRYSLSSAMGEPLLTVSPENQVVSLSQRELIYVPIAVTGSNGEIIVTRKDRVRVILNGPGQVLGYGTDDPLPTEDFHDDTRTLYDGRALLVIRPCAAGVLHIRFEADNLAAAAVKIEIKP